MKLSKVEITNFRCFESLIVPLQPDVNVFVGVNASGKTSILDAIAIALYDIVVANGGGGKRQRSEQDVALKASDIHISPDAEDQVAGRKDYVQIKAQVTDYYEVPGFPKNTLLDDWASIEWTNHIEYSPPNDFIYPSYTDSDIYRYFENLWDEIRKSDPKALIPLPVVAYYRADRRLTQMPKMGNFFELKLEKYDAFRQALNAGTNYQTMCQWFYLRENRELREKFQIQKDTAFEFPDLKAVRLAVTQTLENIKRVFFDDNPPSLKVELLEPHGTPKILELEQLSDGYRNLLAIVLDFARRLAQAHPNWDGADLNPLQAPGILLIDEIELHLHPKWQQTIIPSLRSVFPNTQIIVTTHSPQVLTTVESKNIFIIKDQKLFSAPSGTYGAESNRLMLEVMETQSRPPDNEIADKLRELFRLINEEELTSASALYEELIQRLGSNEPALIEAHTIIKNRQWEKELGL